MIASLAAAGRGLRRAGGQLLPDAVLTLRGPTSARRVALTFDDGPLPMTERYLALLRQHEVRSTFFLVGEQCRAHPGAALEIQRQGHEVANHSDTHRRFTTMGRDEIEGELARAEALLPRGPAPLERPLVRPPQGATSIRTLAVCALAGYRTVLWSLDSGDARVRDPGALARCVAPPRVRSGEIVLLHEDQQWTLDALPPIIDRLRGAGFELCTVSELRGP